MLDVKSFLDRGNFFREGDLFRFYSIEGVPEANDVVNRASD